MLEAKQQYKILVEAVKLLAASYDIQVSSLPDFVDIVDEIVCTYENAFYLLPNLILNDLVSQKATAELITLFNYVPIIYEDVDMCTPSALKENYKWQEIRSLAIQSLEALSETMAPIDLRHIQWVKG